MSVLDLQRLVLGYTWYLLMQDLVPGTPVQEQSTQIQIGIAASSTSTNLISMNEGIAGVSALEPCATFTALVDANRARLLPSVVAPTSAYVRSSLPRTTDAVDNARHCCCFCCWCDTSRALDCNARIGDTCPSTARRVARDSQMYGDFRLARRFGNSLRLASIEPQVLIPAVLLQQAASGMWWASNAYSAAFTPSRI